VPGGEETGTGIEVPVETLVQNTATNAQNIAGNATYIARNTSRISRNSSDIAFNLSQINANASSISANTGLILQNVEELKRQSRGLAGVAALPDMFLASGESIAISGGIGVVNDRVGMGATIAQRFSDRWSLGASAAVSGDQVTGKLQVRWAK
jgi:hypothetical protein